MLKPRVPQQEQGFTLVEVLVAILISTVFVAVAMQAIVIAAVLRVRAQEFAEATTWIQEDLETVKTTAASLQYTSLTTATPAGISITVSSVYGFNVGDVLKVGTESGKIIGSINVSTKTITFTASTALNISQLLNAPVVKTSQCGTTGTPATRNTGFGDSLLDWLEYPTDGNNPNTTQFTVTNNRSKTGKFDKTFTLQRITTVSDTPPYNVLEVSYDVSPTAGGNSLAKLNTDVIPDAAFQCP